jgi:hypothetical protein
MSNAEITKAIKEVQAKLAACKSAGRWIDLQEELRTLRALESTKR